MRTVLRILGVALLVAMVLAVVGLLLLVPGLSKPVTERLRLDLRITQEDGSVWTFENIPVRTNHLTNGSLEGPCSPAEDWFVDLFANGQRSPEGRSGELWVALGEIEGRPHLFNVSFVARGGGPPSTTQWRSDATEDTALEAGRAELRRSGPFWRLDVLAEAEMTQVSQAGGSAQVEYSLKGRTPATFAVGGVMVFDRFCGWR